MNAFLTQQTKIRHFLSFFTRTVAEEIAGDISFVKEKSEHVWWYDSERITFRSVNSGRILNTLMMNPLITLQSLNETIGINPSAIQKHLRQMADKGYIVRREKEGGWAVIITPSA